LIPPGERPGQAARLAWALALFCAALLGFALGALGKYSSAFVGLFVSSAGAAEVPPGLATCAPELDHLVLFLVALGGGFSTLILLWALAALAALAYSAGMRAFAPDPEGRRGPESGPQAHAMSHPSIQLELDEPALGSRSSPFSAPAANDPLFRRCRLCERVRALVRRRDTS